MKDPFLSIVIPCFNEEKRLSHTLDKILSYLRRQNYSWEILVSDDGSTDSTAKLAEEKLGTLPHKLLRNLYNEGKGEAVKRGMLESHAPYVLFTDADLSTPIEEVEKLLTQLQDGFDVAIGSRGLATSQVEVPQNFFRQSMGKIFNRIARLVSFKQIHDSQCGFKCFRRDAAQSLFKAQKLKGFSFDAEIMYLAQKRGLRIAEVPIIWRNSPASRVHILKDSFLMFLDIFRIPWIHR